MRRIIFNDAQFELVKEALQDTAEDWCAIKPDENIEQEGADEYNRKGNDLQAIINDQFR